MRLVGVSLRNLAHRPLRSGFTALGIAVGVASFVALIGTSRGVTEAWTNSLARRGTHLIAFRKGSVEAFSGSVDQSIREELRRVDGIDAVAGDLAGLVALEGTTSIVAVGWERTEYLWGCVSLIAGAMPRPDQPRGVVLGQTMAEDLKKGVGDPLLLEGQSFFVTGISTSTSYLSRNSLIMSLEAMQAFVERPGKINVLEFRVRWAADPNRLAQLRERLVQAFPSLRFHETSELGESDHMLRFLNAIAWSTSLIALLTAILVIMNTLLMSVTERTYDLGVLVAIGWPEKRILSMVLIEGILLAAISSVLGALLGLAILRGLATLPLIRGMIEPKVSLYLLLQVLSAALGVGILGSIYPAWRATRLNPVDALRKE